MIKKHTQEKKGLKEAFDVFEFCSEKIPAYKKFLKKQGVSSKEILKLKKFDLIPVVEKDNYLRRFEIEELVANKKIPPMISASSGSSGKPFYWPRGNDQELWGGILHSNIVFDIFKLKNKKVLAIVCFSMGNWVAGTFTLASLRHVADQKNISLSIITPGIDKEDVIRALKDFAPNFESVILIGYPPFLMDILHEASNTGVVLSVFDMYFILAGENFSEKWRSLLLKKAGVNDTEKNRSISIYGTADACAIGHETPLTIHLRNLAEKNKAFFKDFYGEISFTPTTVVYYPEKTYFELLSDELIFTTNTGIPLVRYNIKDKGLLYTHEDVVALLKKHNVYKDVPSAFLKNKQAILILKGRNDVSVTFYALNIYPENIKTGLEDDSLKDIVTGKYIAKVQHSKDFVDQKLVIEVELQEDVESIEAHVLLVKNSISNSLIHLNAEYRKLLASIQEKAIPEIILKPYGDADFIVKKSKHKWIKKNEN